MRTITIYIAVIPQDYSSADVEVFETREEAERYIKDNAIRPNDEHYCSVLERKVAAE